MTLRQLRYFLAVLEEGSITRAADRLHVAQPSISQQIRALERHVGGELIERLPRSIRPTALGRALEPHARAVVVAADRAEKIAKAAVARQVGELEIATVRSIAVGLLPPSIMRWRQAYPDVAVRLHEFGHRALLEDRVRAGLGDIAIGPRPRRWEGELLPLGWEEFVVVLPEGDPAARGRERISLEDLRDRDWVLFEPQHGLSEVVAFACAAARFVPAPAIQTAQVEAAARLAAAGLGPALIPIDAVPANLQGLALPLDPPIARELTAYTRHSFSPLARAYLEFLEREAGTAPEPPGVVAIP